MSENDDFEPRLGKIRSLGGKRDRSYLSQVLRATALAGGRRVGTGRPNGAFHGSRIGLGSGSGRVLAARDRYSAFRARRVIVKFSLPKISGKGLDVARHHLRYVQRDGVTREGQPGQLYSAAEDRADGKAFLSRAGDGADARQFRFIVSPEDGAEYEDLKPLTRRLMGQMEEDLGTRLDWVAVDHFNTGHPHTHIIVRGRNDRGGDLIIAREYLTQGLRERAAELVSLDLGPRADQEIEGRLRQEVEQERLTSLDRALLKDQDADRLVEAAGRNPFWQSLRAGRLQKLGRLGLAEPVDAGRWRLDPGLETTLRRMGERGDIIKTLYRDLTEKGVDRGAGDYAIYDPAAPGARPLIGRLVRRGLSDELNDRHYLVVDGVDSRVHYADIGRGGATDFVPEGAVIALSPRRADVRAADRTVAEIAAAHGGRYSVDIHLRHDASAHAEFAEAHVRRLESLRRLVGAVERDADGTFVIATDHLDRVAAFEQRQVKGAPVQVQTLSALSLDRQIDADGPTWLDRQLIAETPVPSRDSGFGTEVRSALAQRRQWLIAQDLAREDQDRTLYRGDLLAALQRRELVRAAGQLSGELGLDYAEARPGAPIEGVYRRAVDLAGGRFAVIEKSREFTLVPWRPVLERSRGQPVSGVMRGDAISWTLGRQRSGPSVG